MTSLVLATDIEGVLTSRALAKAAQWLSPSLLISTEIILVALWWAAPGAGVWVATIGLAVMGAAVMTALLATRVWVAIVSITIGGAGSYVYALSVSEQLGAGSASDNLLLSMPKIAVLLAGVGGRSLRSCIALCSLGFVLTTVTSISSAYDVGMIIAFDFPAVASYVAVIGLLVVLWAARGGAEKGASDMNLAGLAEARVSEETRNITHASSVLHDTVLNDLHALALSPPGALSDAQRKLVERDLDLLSGKRERLLAPRSSALAEPSSMDADVHPLASAIDSAEARGLSVTISGNPALLTGLSFPSMQAVVMAVDQCLVNVSRHAGVEEAEVAIAGTDREVTVMITDAGRGFDPETIDPERLGLRISVYDRIQAVGGSVHLWSRPGAGAAVLIAVATVTAQVQAVEA